MKTEALRDLTREELQQRLRELADEDFNLRMRRSLKDLENPLRLRYVRREIARIRTVLSEDQKGIRRLAESKTSILDSAGKKSG